MEFHFYKAHKFQMVAAVFFIQCITHAGVIRIYFKGFLKQ